MIFERGNGFLKYVNENLVVGLLALFLLFYAGQAVIIGDINRLYMVLIPSLVISFLPLLFEYRFKVTLPAGTKSLVVLALLLHVAGGISRFYWKFAPFYDKVAHVVSSVALMMVIFSFFVALDYWGKHFRLKSVLIGSVLIMTVLMVSWEFAEYYIDVLVKSSYNNGMADTIGDLIANVIGIIFALLLIRWETKKIPDGAGIGYLFSGQKDRL
jgi:hypothetical protein